jgi:hypothetical protein
MIREAPLGVADAPEAYSYLRDDQTVISFRIFPESANFAISWHGRADLRQLLASLPELAREVGEFATALPQAARSFMARYLVGKELFEIDYFPDPTDNREEALNAEHEALVRTAGSKMSFARWDARAKTPMAFWADLGDTPKPEIGFSSAIVPNHIFTLFQQTQPTGFSENDLRQIRRSIERHLERHIQYA